MRMSSVFRTTNQERGFSLLEVLASTVIFAVVAMGATAGTITTIRGNTISRMNMAASSLIYDQVEKFRSLDPATNPDEFQTGTHDDPANPVDANGDTGGKFYRSWEVTRNTPTMRLAEIVLTVTWHDTGRRSISSTTYVCLAENCS